MENKEEKERKNYMFPVIFIVLLLIILSILIYFIKYITSISPKADDLGYGVKISISNSYVFASPVRAKAGGDLIRITVFILDQNGRGLSNKNVVLGSNNVVLIKEMQSLTDETGKALFDVSSEQAGTFYLEALVGGKLLPQRVKITFD